VDVVDERTVGCFRRKPVKLTMKTRPVPLELAITVIEPVINEPVALLKFSFGRSAW
jgi:hypothetical protein